MPAELDAPMQEWLTVVGIGEDGVAGLGDEAKRAISGAAHVFGAKRHLALAATLIAGAARPWPTPFDSEMRDVVALRGENVCVLASGDPFLNGVGVTLARAVPSAEMRVLPAPSAFSLAASRLGWALQDIETVSLHGHAIDLIRPLLQPGARIIALTSDGEAPAQIAALVTGNGFGASCLTVLEALGGESERIRATTASGFDLENINPLNVLALELESGSQARILPLASGLADDLFEHDGQITKREIRAVTLSTLAPRRGELLWDIGAGSGSISVEWMLCHTSLRAIAIEHNAERAERIERNAGACGVPGLTVVRGAAPDALIGLPTPDVIFIGGGGSDAGVFDAAIAALRSGGRLVANAVTLEMETLLLSHHAAHGGDLLRLQVSRAAPVGSMTGWRPAMPVTQWSWVKP
ncbi:precorrin-6y C5,15-methyltransferase (decarboxylating) subunit CbiE [Aminobacter ciceronei]|jgi:precorrin-6Y C5,15-methyltransferase (decarboxylating)|uniref:Precorrin-6Y C5,15-methyltransferase (Decarboxylating) n=1 Tax=Aminobacter ciceronei TaxID=150723 RepID=A0ABR6C180_9HYPH|nr:precorrin-6y C5,15-methyltransferase (decarboxylating) subunit CbiE [Aminobacter ciceronei]MBA8904722.1 precorrin-6Y C5,15-methyltransferase (decarboxylating) [Aminobacter ciceronei]MBA9018724.1 precorrin-6Y C5,15-methyltransferase (decarboxylating) [Aminobacter ciceronei]WMC95088.1 precorrin-6y C5,15-methyltransferase (decarboxylating) subunit CbiE [Aminobacter aminovorans]